MGSVEPELEIVRSRAGRGNALGCRFQLEVGRESSAAAHLAP